MTDFSDVCKKARPLAAPMAIFSLVSHESGSGPSASTRLEPYHHGYVRSLNKQFIV